MRISAAILALGLSLGTASGAMALTTTTNGLTFTVANDGPGTTGSHFHSSTPTGDGGFAEVGRLFVDDGQGNEVREEIRGLSEFDLTGLVTASEAILQFEVLFPGGLFDLNADPFDGIIALLAYEGDNFESLGDFQITPTTPVSEFAIDPITFEGGDVIALDITALYNSFIANGISALGIRLENSPLAEGSQAWTFGNFQLLTETTPPPPPPVEAPEPATLGLLSLGVAALALRRKR